MQNMNSYSHQNEYSFENHIFNELLRKETSEEHARKIIAKVARHFKLGKIQVVFFGESGGLAHLGWNQRIRLPHHSNHELVAHELAHFLAYKKYRRKVRHGSRKWIRSVERVIRYCESKGWWENELTRLQEQKQQTQQKNAEAEKVRDTPTFKLQQIRDSIKRWETKQKRAATALKKLHRREGIWMGKVGSHEIDTIKR
jgi:predicted SprT family Zn-dependent metalloprotease